MGVDPYLFPARGRKLCCEKLVHVILPPALIPTFSPQGDGNTLQVFSLGVSWPEVDPYLFPARGRKHYLLTGTALTFRGVDPYLFPARGRKLDSAERAKPGLLPLIPTFSPQGDGNPLVAPP